MSLHDRLNETEATSAEALVAIDAATYARQEAEVSKQVIESWCAMDEAIRRSY